MKDYFRLRSFGRAGAGFLIASRFQSRICGDDLAELVPGCSSPVDSRLGFAEIIWQSWCQAAHRQSIPVSIFRVFLYGGRWPRWRHEHIPGLSRRNVALNLEVMKCNRVARNS